ncbi:MAG: inosose dehydratase [Solirubrobacteraceae bacterium]|nr:inosose dehydratase [Solirubrobacteraceae bacterium]
MGAGPVSGVRVANAPLSYGAFEMTVGTDFQVPDPEDVLGAIAGAGYAGTDLGPPGYYGEGDLLRERLEDRALEVVGGFVPIAFSERDRWDEGLGGLRHTLDLFDAAGASGARPVLCDAGGPDRLANPGRGGEDPALRLGDGRWAALVEGVARAADTARERGYDPVFHHHTSTYVEGVPEIERFLGDTDVELLLDSGHLAVAGGDPIAGLRDWGERIGAVHLKDTRLDVLAAVKADRADTLTAWRRGLFCALGDGDVDLDGFCAELGRSGYEGWVVIEQDRVLEGNGAFGEAVAEQERNRAWLREHPGW